MGKRIFFRPVMFKTEKAQIYSFESLVLDGELFIYIFFVFSDYW